MFEREPVEEAAPKSGEVTLEMEQRSAPGPWLVEIGSVRGTTAASLQLGDRVVLGHGRLADIRAEDPAVSARHAAITATERGPIVEDLDSRNGLYVGGARVGRAVLGPGGATFVMGRTTVVVRPMPSGAGASVDEHIRIDGLVGSSEPMRRLCRDIVRVSRFGAPVLLQGETGSGKDVVATCIHSHSRRVGQYVPLNVGTLAESLADSELFGHARGAFTGAVSNRIGAFEQAHRGTLFLDEIAELAPNVQVKLLRAVEQNEIRPVGGAKPVRLDVRLISATWAPLEMCVAEGRFRADLFHRMTTFIIEVPPLRRRKSDIPALSAALLARRRNELGDKELSSGALARLAEYGWPGNVRELGAVLYRAATLARGTSIDAVHVAAAIPQVVKVRAPALTGRQARDLVALHQGNVSAAARTAGVARTTFRGWLKAD